MPRERGKKFAAVEAPPFGVNAGSFAQAANQRVAIVQVEFSDGRGLGRFVFGTRLLGEIERSTHHDPSAFGTFTGDDDRLGAHLGSHIGERRFHVTGEERTKLHDLTPVPMCAGG